MIGQHLKEQRKLKGKTTQQLADYLGLTHQQISKYELGKDRLSAETMFNICKWLKLDPKGFYVAYLAQDNK